MEIDKKDMKNVTTKNIDKITIEDEEITEEATVAILEAVEEAIEVVTEETGVIIVDVVAMIAMIDKIIMTVIMITNNTSSRIMKNLTKSLQEEVIVADTEATAVVIVTITE